MPYTLESKPVSAPTAKQPRVTPTLPPFSHILAQLNAQAMQTSSLDAFKKECMKSVLDNLGVDATQFVKVDTASHELSYEQSMGRKLGSRRLSLRSNNYAALCFRYGKPKSCLDMADSSVSDKKWFEKKGIISVLGVPVMGGHVYSGVLLCYTWTTRRFASNEVHFLKALHSLLYWFTIKAEHERETHMSEKKYKVFFDQHPQALFLYDPKNHRILDVNKAATEHYGYSKEDFLGMGLLELYGKEERKRLEVLMGKPSFSIDKIPPRWPHRTREGKKITVELFANPIRYQQRDLIIIQANNITDRFKAEREQKRLYKKQLEQNAELQKFAYITSHNLRAPIVNLSSLLKLLDKESLHKSTWNMEIVERFELSVSKMEETLSDLVRIISIQKESALPRTHIALQRFIEKKVIPQISEKLKSTQAIVQLDFSRLTHIVYIRSHLESILLNLFTNAIKYRNKGRRLRIRLWGAEKPSYHLIVFQDNGRGIDLKMHKYSLFGLYQRFHEDIPEGKGMGLHLIHTQIKALGGKIDVKSEVDKGTIFEVHLKKLKEDEKNMDD